MTWPARAPRWLRPEMPALPARPVGRSLWGSCGGSGLCDGENVDNWVGSRGKRAEWKVEDGYMEGNGESIVTKEKFGDVQLHVEWAEPTPAKGSSQGRGNSGVLLAGGRYEV